MPEKAIGIASRDIKAGETITIQVLNDGKPYLESEAIDFFGCIECMDTGFISVDEDDGEGHTAVGVGQKKCPNH